MKDRSYLPKFLQKIWEEPSKKKNDKITDFTWLIQKVWCISNKEYQERIWARHEDKDKIVDSYGDSTMYFIEETDTVLEAKDAGRVKMTNNQYQMLKKLYNTVDAYEMNKDFPENDEDIIKDPIWKEIREYAKLVYDELTK